MCRHSRDAQAGADIEVGLVRQQRRSRFIDCDVLCCRSEAARELCLVDPHTFANTRFIDAVADSLDDSCAIAVRYYQAVIEQVGE
jgi:hypothetical protein